MLHKLESVGRLRQPITLVLFVSGGRRHAILFQSPAGHWAASQDEVQAFLAGYRPRG